MLAINKKPMRMALLIIAGMSIAATSVEKGQLIEIQQLVNARSQGLFRDTDQNRIYQLKRNTKAVVENIKYFANGNMGLCLDVVNAETRSSQDCYWVYFRKEWLTHPEAANIKLFNLTEKDEAGKKMLNEWKDPSNKVSVIDLKPELNAQAISAPVVGAAAVAVKDIPAIKDPVTPKPAPAPKPVAAPVSAPAPAPAVAPPTFTRQSIPSFTESGADAATESILKSVAEKAVELRLINNSITQPIPATIDDPCGGMCIKPAVTKYESCQLVKANSYIHAEINEIRKSEPQNAIIQILNNPDDSKYVKEDCFQGSLTNFGGPYQYCAKGQKGIPKNAKPAPRACADIQYTSLIRKSFDAVGDCLGDYLSGNPQTAKDSMVELFGLLSLESGLNINSRSHAVYCTVEDITAKRFKCKSTEQRKAGGAGGTGQLVQDAINAVNRTELGLMKNHIQQKLNNPDSNPSCKVVLEQLNNPMSSKTEEDCDRISISKGNPLKNLIYSLSYQKILRSEVRGYRLESNLARRIFQNLSAKDKDYLERQLGIWAHNSGAYALNTALGSYIQSYNGKPLTSKQDIIQFLDKMRPAMSRSISGRVKVEEPVNFWNRIQKRMSDLDKSYGGGTCVVGK